MALFIINILLSTATRWEIDSYDEKHLYLTQDEHTDIERHSSGNLANSFKSWDGRMNIQQPCKF